MTRHCKDTRKRGIKMRMTDEELDLLLEDYEEQQEEDKDGINATFYLYSGSSTRRNIQHSIVTNIYDGDKVFIKQNKLLLSLEELATGEFVAYLRHPEEDEDKEIAVLAMGRTCEETIKELVARYKKYMKVRCNNDK